MFLIKLIVSICLFLCSGIASSYLYITLGENGGAFFPGLFYTGATLIVFAFNKRLNEVKWLLLYSMVMYLTYMTVYFVTFLISFMVIFVGIGTAGAGALITFIVTDKCMSPIQFNKLHVFLLGGLAFLMTDILHLARLDDTSYLTILFNLQTPPGSIYTLYADVFIFWQLIVGIKLFLTTKKM